MILLVSFVTIFSTVPTSHSIHNVYDFYNLRLATILIEISRLLVLLNPGIFGVLKMHILTALYTPDVHVFSDASSCSVAETVLTHLKLPVSHLELSAAQENYKFLSPAVPFIEVPSFIAKF